MPMNTIPNLDALFLLAGHELGTGEWMRVDQERIDRFADVTEDRQWLHVDPERARSGPYGTTIAHGYLTLSLLPVLASSVVPAGARLRVRAELLSIERTAAGAKAVVRNTVEIEGSGRPACVADTVSLYIERKDAG
jgi:acyl dehydratase